MPTHSSLPAPTSAGPLPPALALMAPFDLLASLAMDVPARGAGHARGPADHAHRGPADPQRLHADAGTGPIDLRSAVRPHRPAAGGAGRRAAACRRVLALAAAGSGGLFVALRLLQALGASAALVAMFATVRDVYADRPEGATIYGLFSAMLAFVPALGPMLGAAIAAASAGGRSSSRWARRACWRGCAPCRAGARPVHPRRSARRPGFAPMLGSLRFWIYTLGFSAAMGAFRVLRPRRACSWARPATPMAFSAAFSTVALVMIAATRLAPRLVARWASPAASRAAATMLAGAALLAGCAATTAPSFATFVMPMWLVAAGWCWWFRSAPTARWGRRRVGRRGGAVLRRAKPYRRRVGHAVHADAGRRQRLAAGRLLRRHAHGLPAGTGPAATQEAARRED